MDVYRCQKNDEAHLLLKPKHNDSYIHKNKLIKKFVFAILVFKNGPGFKILQFDS